MRRPHLLLRIACYLSLAIPILACGSSGPTCLGWVEHEGTRYSPESGTNEGPDQAQRFACNGYCIDGDPQAEAMYQIWLSSPQGNPAVSRRDAMYENESLMEYVTHTCADRCLADISSGALQGGVDCD